MQNIKSLITASISPAVASVPSKRRRIQPESVPLSPTIKNPKSMAAPIAISDHDFAFELQMQEAIAASAGDLDFAAAQEIPRSERDQFNLRPCKGKLGAIGGGDLGFDEYFSLYFKGLVVENKNTAKLGAIGVAIFDSSNAVVFEVAKPLVLREAEMTDEVAELEAFVQGLEFALSLEIKIVMCASLDFNLYPYFYGSQKGKEAKVAELVDRALLLKNRFRRCHLSLYKKNAQVVLQLARSSIEKQAGKPFMEVVLVTENCSICLEDVDSRNMFETGSCRHRFCSSCTQNHVQHKVRERVLPLCPQHNCGLVLNINACRKFLDPKMYDIMDQLVREASIPATERVYCPNPRCSYLMSKTKALANNGSVAGTSKVELTACTCVKCRSKFCINCRVLWHSNMSCDAYKKWELVSNAADERVKMLAGEKKWRQCPKCSHMVELALGCNHIYCRCGHQFCYVCGSKWKNKKATCSCKLWSEENLILRRAANRQ